MENDNMKQVLELSKKNLWDLVEELHNNSQSFIQDFMSLNSELAAKTAKRTRFISGIILGRRLEEREEYFFSEARLLISALGQGNYKLIEELKGELGYFQHRFLDLSPCKNTRIEYNALKRLLEPNPRQTL